MGADGVLSGGGDEGSLCHFRLLLLQQIDSPVATIIAGKALLNYWALGASTLRNHLAALVVRESLGYGARAASELAAGRCDLAGKLVISSHPSH